MIEFSHPLWLWGLIPVLLLFPFFFWLTRRDRRNLLNHFSPEVLNELLSDRGISLKKYHIILEIIALMMIIISLAGPRVGTQIRELKREGVDLIVALDLSRSMTAQDVAPSRLARAKFESRKFINILRGDRIGLLGFAGIAHLQCPLTLDHAAATMLLDVMDETLLPVQGTALAEAIDIACKSFSVDKGKNRALIILSDGEDHEESVEEAAQKAKDEGVVIYTIGVGTPKGAPIPIYKDEEVVDYKRNNANQVVTSQLSEYSLQRIADITGGTYIRLSDTKDPMKKVYDLISTQDFNEYQTHDFSQYEEFFQITLLLAFILLLSEGFLPYVKQNKSVNLK